MTQIRLKIRLKIDKKSQLKSTKWGVFISDLRCWERTPKIQWKGPLGVCSLARAAACVRSGVAPANQTKERSVHQNFSQGHSGTKVKFVNLVLVFLRKTSTRIHLKMCEIHELFVLALSLVWFAGATPDACLRRLCCFAQLSSLRESCHGASSMPTISRWAAFALTRRLRRRECVSKI